MNENVRLKYLRYALMLFGVVLVVGVYPLTVVWPSGWSWGQSEYLAMILGVYATLGVFLVLAARDPLRHLSLIWFAVWSSIVHAAIMAIQAFMNSDHMGHLVGDVPTLLLVAAVLAFLTPQGKLVAAA